MVVQCRHNRRRIRPGNCRRSARWRRRSSRCPPTGAAPVPRPAATDAAEPKPRRTSSASLRHSLPTNGPRIGHPVACSRIVRARAGESLSAGRDSRSACCRQRPLAPLKPTGTKAAKSVQSYSFPVRAYARPSLREDFAFLPGASVVPDEPNRTLSVKECRVDCCCEITSLSRSEISCI